MPEHTTKHRWRFFRAGGFEQARLDRGEDLLALSELDQKLWVALACPIDGLELDPKTLSLVDLDKDGRIRAPELLAALAWVGGVLKDPNSLLEGSPTLPLSAIKAESEEGRQLLASAKQILKNLGKKGAGEISIDDTTDTVKIFAGTRFNGDGIVPPSSADSEEDVKKVIEEILPIVGAEKDRSGQDGISQEKLDKLFAEAEAFAEWWKKAETDAANVRPLGDATAEAASAFRAVKAKIDDYFTRVRLASFDPRAASPLNRDPAEYTALAAKTLRDDMDEVASFPIARVEANRPLPLDSGLNPAWSGAVAKLKSLVVLPLLGEKDRLTEEEWRGLSARLEAFEKWLAEKAGAAVESLGIERVRAILAGGYKDKISDLIAKDKALEPEANAIGAVDKLVRYHRDLYKLVCNFVSFRDFYGHKKATFQIGTLYLDSRSCDFCVKVHDATAHAGLATSSGVYLAYCDLTRKGSDEKMTIAAAFTNGDSDNLVVGRNGIFYDRRGCDWDATIVKLIEQPISIRQAFWLPYKRIGKLIGAQLEKFAASRDKEVEEKAAANVATSGQAVETGAAAPPKEPFDVGKFAGIFAAIGLAIGAIGSVLVAVATGFVSLAWWQMPLVVIGILLLISLPSMFLAYLKLRKRNIAPILDANGWAVNARAKLNVPFGASLTQVAKLPPHAELSPGDPFAERKTSWVVYLVLLLLLAGAAYWQRAVLREWMEKLQAPPPAQSAPPTPPAPPGTAK